MRLEKEKGRPRAKAKSRNHSDAGPVIALAIEQVDAEVKSTWAHRQLKESIHKEVPVRVDSRDIAIAVVDGVTQLRTVRRSQPARARENVVQARVSH